MGRRRCASWQAPAIIPKQGSLFLGACNGDAQFPFAVRPDPKWRYCQTTNDFSDIRIAQPQILRQPGRCDIIAVWHKLQGSHAVAADLVEQAEGICPLRPYLFSDLAPDLVGVGKEVVEEGRYLSPIITLFPQWERKRDGYGPARIGEPSWS
jgi:hypothetical protein